MSGLNSKPKQIVIIGGGVVGVCTAYFLTSSRLHDPKAHSITLLETCDIAIGSSGKAGGFLASWATPKCLAPLSFGLHQRLARDHGGEEIWGFRPVFAAEVHLRARESENANGSTSLNHPSRLDWLYPDSIEAYKEVGKPSDSAQVHPALFTKKMAHLAEQNGLKVILGSAKSINYDSSGSAVKSVTYIKDGTDHQLEATDVLVAAGPWSSTFVPRLKLLAPKGHSIVVKPARDLSPYILFPEIQSSASLISPDIYPRPRDTLNGFDTVYSSGPDYYNSPLPDLARDIVLEDPKCDEVWHAVRSVSQEIHDGEIMAKQACYKAQIRKHDEGEEVGPMVGPLVVNGLWLATGLDEWGIQNGPGVGLVMSEMILEGKASSADVTSLNPNQWLEDEL